MFNQIKTGNNNISIITDDTINKIAKTKIFNDDRDDKLYELHKSLLKHAKKHKSAEVCILWDYLTDKDVVIPGNIKGVNLRTNPDAIELFKNSYSILAMHNHPRNGLFSSVDIRTFAVRTSIRIMTVVCNDGTIYVLKKENNFNAAALMQIYNDNVGKYPYSGTKAIGKYAKKIGVKYNCSVKRRF